MLVVVFVVVACYCKVNKHGDLTSTETIRLFRDGEKRRKRVWRWGKREIIYLSLHRHHQNDSCIKMGSDDSHFNVSLIVPVCTTVSMKLRG